MNKPEQRKCLMRFGEQKLQQWFTVYLNSLNVLFCSSAAGARTSIGTAIKLKRAGLKKGFPDMGIFEPRANWHGMFIELKLKSYAGKEQKIWREELLKRNYYAIIMPGNLEYQEACTWLENETEKYLEGKIPCPSS